MSKKMQPESGSVKDAGSPERELNDDELEAVRGGSGRAKAASTPGAGSGEPSFTTNGNAAVTGNYVTPSSTPSSGSRSGSSAT